MTFLQTCRQETLLSLESWPRSHRSALPTWSMPCIWWTRPTEVLLSQMYCIQINKKKSSYHMIIMQSGTYSHCWCSERIKVQSGHKRGWVRADWTCLGANYIQAATMIITPNQSRSTFDKDILEMMDSTSYLTIPKWLCQQGWMRYSANDNEKRFTKRKCK